ncbi:26S proteasome non-ATPase regulatory subunit 2-like [Nasonia vitripennis]|uniref:26S proteasome non-ATPase regulatory subunit 2 n=1 Tax=Nasonia vitripennis TaxID=7425 RepID=A0A7M7G7S1_NASVI|nr:26S proteasome non-ATPase regulatory subunit 2-like [Nasonia vitripennis]
MATDAKKRKIFDEKDAELSDEDKKLQDDLRQLVEDVVENRSVSSALSNLRKLMRSSTTSMTAVPKPLKYLKDSYPVLIRAHKKKTDPKEAARLADVISVLALAASAPGKRDCLDYCLRGTLANPGDWGHEYVRRLEMEIVEEWLGMPYEQEKTITERLLPLVKKILIFDAKHHAEIQACDLCLEIGRLDLLSDCLDENNYSKVCRYLASSADYTEDLERRDLLKAVTTHYLKFHEYSRAVLVALQLPDTDLVRECFAKCQDPLIRKQMAFVLARQKDQAQRKDYAAADLEAILSNSHVNGYFQTLARELDILEPKTPEEIYRSWLETRPDRLAEYDSARANLAATFASAFVHTGFGQDKLMADTEQCWVYKNKDHAMLSATASLGLIYLWDVDGGLVPIDKFLYATDDLVKSGALLAIGLVNCGVQSECDPALALLSEYVMSPSQNLRIGAILGLGLAYAASRRNDLNELLVAPLADKESTMEVVALSAVALGLVNVGSGDAELSQTILQKLLELDSQQLSSTYSRFLPLALGLIYMGRRENIEALSAALDVLPDPYKLPAQTMIQVCSYAGSGDVLVVQELLRICSEPVEGDTNMKKSSTSVNRQPSFGCCDPQRQTNNSEGNVKKSKSKSEEVPTEISLTQPIASLGVAIVGLSDGKENSRIFGQIGRYGAPPARTAVPLCFALSYLSNPDPGLLDVLNKYSHDNDPNVALNAIFALGLIGAGTNNARLATILRQLAAFHSRDPAYLFLIRIAQGLVHMGKGTITLQPLKFSSKVLDQASLAGLLVVLVSFLDCKNLILGKSHYLMYCLALAMEPRWLVTLDENLELLPVSVRVGQAVDVLGKAGNPKSITGGHVHTTPLLMAHGEKAELVSNDEYEPLVDPMEGVVILRAKIA